MTTVLQAAELLRGWDDILILTHKRPDGDTIGSAVALCRALRALGKQAWLLESKDATRLFQPYLEDCTAPDTFVARRIVAVDIADEGLFPPNAQDYRGKVDLAIDHHPSNTGFAAANCVEADKAACGEIVYQLLLELGALNPEVAAPLYVAVSTDTGCFAYSNTTAHTHRVAAALMDQGIDAAALNKRHFRTKSLKRLRLESAIMQHMELYQNDTIAVAPVTLEMMAEIGATEDDAEDIAAFLGQVEGVLHSITIRELRPGECKVSLRTDPNCLSATRVCALLGGGGHAAASGCTVHGTMRETIDAMLRAIETVQAGQDTAG